MWTLHGFLFNVLCIESELRSQFVLFHGNPSNPSNDIHMHCMEARPWFHRSHACIIYFSHCIFFLLSTEIYTYDKVYNKKKKECFEYHSQTNDGALLFVNNKICEIRIFCHGFLLTNIMSVDKHYIHEKEI